MEKLNITKFLKDCPQGMKLNCVILDNLYFDKISEDEQSKYPIFCFTIDENGNRNSISFTENGCVTTRYGSKCVIFPEGKTTWKGFQRPFKDGDIVFYNDTIAIFKEWGDETLFRTYVTKYLCCDFMIDKNVPLFGKSVRKEIRFATEEEKEILFNAIKDNDYRWNDATKTLEKLIEPKFKVGNEIVRRNSVRFPGRNSWIVVSINSNFYEIKLSKGIGNIGVIPISEQDDWELVLDGPKFKVGDRIKLKDNPYNIPSVRIKAVTNSQYILEDGGFLYISSTDEKYILDNKFDVNTLEPFQKMLTRTAADTTWGVDFFGYYKDGYFYCSGHIATRYAVPYKGNEHLLKSKNECDDYYKVWE
jgi:hypothetical protein